MCIRDSNLYRPAKVEQSLLLWGLGRCCRTVGRAGPKLAEGRAGKWPGNCGLGRAENFRPVHISNAVLIHDKQMSTHCLLTEKTSLVVFCLILWIMPLVYTVSSLHPDPQLLLPQGSDLPKPFPKSIPIPIATVPSYNMALTTICKPTCSVFICTTLFYI